VKEIMAIIRPNKMTRTKEVLATLGFPSLTAWRVLGRGKQKGLAGEVAFEVPTEGLEYDRPMKYIPKRLISLVVEDDDALLVIGAIMKVNRTGELGDGRIFVCPVEDAVRIRTRERSVSAIS
jgi:nitrogen regulatory protein PII 2